MLHQLIKLDSYNFHELSITNHMYAYYATQDY